MSFPHSPCPVLRLPRVISQEPRHPRPPCFWEEPTLARLSCRGGEDVIFLHWPRSHRYHAPDFSESYQFHKQRSGSRKGGCGEKAEDFFPLFPGGQNFSLYKPGQEHRKNTGFPFKMNTPRHPGIGWMGKNIYKHTYPQMICILKCALHRQIQIGKDTLINSYTCVVKTALDTFTETQFNSLMHTHACVGTHRSSRAVTFVLRHPYYRAFTSWILASIVLQRATSHLIEEDRAYRSTQRPLYGVP